MPRPDVAGHERCPYGEIPSGGLGSLLGRDIKFFHRARRRREGGREGGREGKSEEEKVGH